MKKIQYFEILKRAFIMVWENKFLWFFGLLIFIGTPFTSFSFNSEGTTQQNDKNFEAILSYIQKYPKIFIGLFLSLIILMIVLFVLRIIATAAVIKSTNNIVVFRQSKVSSIFSEAKKYFWQLMLLEIIIIATLIVIMIILFTPVFYLWMLKATILAIASATIAAIILLVLIIIAKYLRKYAYFYMVLGNMKIRMALESAYLLLQKNVWKSLIMGCIEIVLVITAMMLLSAVLLLLAPVYSLLVFFAHLLFSQVGITASLIFCFIIGCAFLLIFFSFFTAFAQSAWVLFFQEISLEKKEEKKISEKIEVAEKIPNPEVI